MHTTPTPSAALRARSARAPGQAGATLIEVILAVLIAGAVILSLVIGMLTMTRASAATADNEQVDAGLASFSESLRATEYLPCDHLATPGDAVNYQAQYDAWPERWNARSGMDAAVVEVEYWDGTGYVGTCSGADRGAQRLTLQVSWRDTERQTHIVKRQR